MRRLLLQVPGEQTTLTTSLARSAEVRVLGLDRKYLQYGSIQWMIGMYMGVKVAPSSNIEIILHNGFNLIISLYAVYAVPHSKKAPKEAFESGAVTNTVRFNYVMLFVYGLAATVFQVGLFSHCKTTPTLTLHPPPNRPTSSLPCLGQSITARASTGGAPPCSAPRVR